MTVDVIRDLHMLADAELDALLSACADERWRRQLIRDAPARAAQLAQDFELAVGTRPLITWADLVAATDRVGPGQRVVWVDGEAWRNTSGAWLPVTATPDTYPLGWAQESGLPAEVRMWVAGESVQVGDLREFGGIVYRCLQAHTTQAGWRPDLVPALWAEQGGE